MWRPLARSSSARWSSIAPRTNRIDSFDVQLVGYDPEIGLGGPLEIAEGKSPPGPGEIVVDVEMNKRHGVEIGDRLVRGPDSLTVVGFARGGDFIYTQVGFATLETTIDFLHLQPETTRTFFVVKLYDPSKRDLSPAGSN